MKPQDFIVENEFIGDDAHNMHKDHEVQMAREECYHTAKSAIELHKLLKTVTEVDGLPGWVSEYISICNDHMKSVWEYLDYELRGRHQDTEVFNPQLAESRFAEAMGVAEGTESGLQPGTQVMLWLGPRDKLPQPPRDDKKYWDRGVVVDAPEIMSGSWQVLVKSERKGQSPISPERVFILKKPGMDETITKAAPGAINRLEHRGEEYNVYFNQRKGMYTARGTGEMAGEIQPEWFPTLVDAIVHAEMEIGGRDEHDDVAEGSRYNADGSPKNVGLKAAQKFGKEQDKKTALHHFAKGAAKDDLSKFKKDKEPGVAEGTSNDYFKRRKDEEERIAGTKAPAKRTPKQTDYEKKRKEQGVTEALIPDWDLERHGDGGYPAFIDNSSGHINFAASKFLKEQEKKYQKYAVPADPPRKGSPNELQSHRAGMIEYTTNEIISSQYGRDRMYQQYMKVGIKVDHKIYVQMKSEFVAWFINFVGIDKNRLCVTSDGLYVGIGGSNDSIFAAYTGYGIGFSRIDKNTMERYKKKHDELLAKEKQIDQDYEKLSNRRKGMTEGSRMPSEIIKTKQKLAMMTPEELLSRFEEVARRTGKSVEQLAREQAWRHGYGKMSPFYWDKIQKAEKGMTEGRFELDRKSGQMRHNKDDADQRHGLYINNKLITTYATREQAENVKKRDAKFKDATIKKIAEGAKVDRMVKTFSKDTLRKGVSEGSGDRVNETTSAAVSTVPAVGRGSQVGSLFGGSYSPRTPFTRKKKTRESMIKR